MIKSTNPEGLIAAIKMVQAMLYLVQEWKEAGGVVDESGFPSFSDAEKYQKMSEFLGLPVDVTKEICEVEDITLEILLEKLKAYL